MLNLSLTKNHNQRQQCSNSPNATANQGNQVTNRPKHKRANTTPQTQSQPNHECQRPHITFHQPNRDHSTLLSLRVSIPKLIMQRRLPPLLGPRFNLHGLTLNATRALRIKDEVIELCLEFLLLCTGALDGRHGRKWGVADGLPLALGDSLAFGWRGSVDCGVGSLAILNF